MDKKGQRMLKKGKPRLIVTDLATRFNDARLTAEKLRLIRSGSRTPAASHDCDGGPGGCDI
jgi:hypothetical protein